MPGFQVTCKIEGCRDTFNTVRYFVRHVNRKHKNMQTANKHFDAFTDIDCDDTESNADLDVATCTGEFICGNIGTRSSLEHVVSDFEKQVVSESVT
jgi:hypothetical protein